MKNVFLKIGAIASLSTGAVLVAQPAFAAWNKCIGGGFHPVENWSSCRIDEFYDGTDPANGGNSTMTYSPAGDCGGRKDPKGYYCEEQTQTVTNCTTDANTTARVQRYDGSCQIRFVISGVSGFIPSGSWVKSLGSSPNGPTPTLEQSNYEQARGQCSKGRSWYPSSGSITIGQCH